MPWLCLACLAEKNASTKQENPRVEKNAPSGQSSEQNADDEKKKGEITSNTGTQSSVETNSSQTDRPPPTRVPPAQGGNMAPVAQKPPIETKRSPSKRKVEFSRADLPPRAEFAEKDLEILNEYFYSDDSNMPKGFKKLAEVFQFDGFRAVPSLAEDAAEPHRVLLLGYSIKHLHDTLNFLAALAKYMHEEGAAADRRNLSSCYPVPIVVLQLPPPNPGGRYSLDRSKIIVQIDAAQSDYIKQVPLNEKILKFWPEAIQLEMTFGTERILFIFPSVITFGKSITTKLLEGKTLLQTPWILRALEGENIKALWQAVSGFEADFTDIQMGSPELIYKVYSPNLFESIWDERSEFFPKQNAFRIIDKFKESIRIFPGLDFYGYKKLEFLKLRNFRLQIEALSELPVFTFKNNKS